MKDYELNPIERRIQELEALNKVSQGLESIIADTESSIKWRTDEYNSALKEATDENTGVSRAQRLRYREARESLDKMQVQLEYLISIRRLLTKLL